MNILMTIMALDTGGAEWAFVRQANALAERHAVTAYIPYACDSKPALMRAFDAAVRVVSLPLPHRWFHKLIYKITLLFPGLDLEQRIHSGVLRMLHRLKNFAVVNPHLRGAALMACAAFKHVKLPVVESDHGDYALLQKEDPEMKRHHLLIDRLDAIVCPSRANEHLIRSLPWQSIRTTIIPYALPVQKKVGRALPPGPFTYGIVARGIVEKGWEEALAAFRLLKQRVKTPLRLVFVGEGECLARLKLAAGNDEGVVFAGYQPEAADWIASFDVGLLPSFFPAESLPNAIIECVAQGRPVIATDVGGISEMLVSDAGPCGVLIPIDQSTGRASIPHLAAAMQSLLEDSALFGNMSTSARRAAQRYLPERCRDSYETFFADLIHSTALTA